MPSTNQKIGRVIRTFTGRALAGLLMVAVFLSLPTAGIAAQTAGRPRPYEGQTLVIRPAPQAENLPVGTLVDLGPHLFSRNQLGEETPVPEATARRIGKLLTWRIKGRGKRSFLLEVIRVDNSTGVAISETLRLTNYRKREDDNFRSNQAGCHTARFTPTIYLDSSILSGFGVDSLWIRKHMPTSNVLAKLKRNLGFTQIVYETSSWAVGEESFCVPVTTTTTTVSVPSTSTTSTTLPQPRLDLTVRRGSPTAEIVEEFGSFNRDQMMFVCLLRYPLGDGERLPFPRGTSADFMINGEDPFRISDAEDLLHECHSFTPGNRGATLDIRVILHLPDGSEQSFGPKRYLLVNGPVTSTSSTTTSTRYASTTTSTTLPGSEGQLRLYRPDWNQIQDGSAVYSSGGCLIWAKVYLHGGLRAKGGVTGTLTLLNSSGSPFAGFPVTVTSGADFAISGHSFTLGYPLPYLDVVVGMTVTDNNFRNPRVVQFRRRLLLKSSGTCYN